MKSADIRYTPTWLLVFTSVSIALLDEILHLLTDAHDEDCRWHNVKGMKVAHRLSHRILSNSLMPTHAGWPFFILTYLKNNPIQEYHGACFGMGQQHCGDLIHTLTVILRKAAQEAKMLPADDIASLTRLLEERVGDTVVHDLILDGTERKIPRPFDYELQKG